MMFLKKPGVCLGFGVYAKLNLHINPNGCVVELLQDSVLLHEQVPRGICVDWCEEDPCWPTTSSLYHGMPHNHGIDLLQVVRAKAWGSVVQDKEFHLTRGAGFNSPFYTNH